MALKHWKIERVGRRYVGGPTPLKMRLCHRTLRCSGNVRIRRYISGPNEGELFHVCYRCGVCPPGVMVEVAILAGAEFK